MADDTTRCPGFPTIRDTVRPIMQCQQCARWQQAGSDEQTPRYTTAPGQFFTDAQVFACDYFKSA